MDNLTQVQHDDPQDSSLPEGAVLLNSASEAGNWDLVRDVISDADVSPSDIRQSFLLQKLESATVDPHLVRDILKKIFSSEASVQCLTSVARDVLIKAAHCDNWEFLIDFLLTTDTLLEDEKSLLSVIRLMASSQMLQEKPFLHMDVFTALWKHANQKIIDSKDKSVQNTLLQMAAELNMWSRVCDLLVTKPVLNLLDREGLSVLHRLVMCSDSRFDSLLPVLLENGADATLKNSEGNTALHLAAKHPKIRTQIIDDYRKNRAESRCHTSTTLVDSCCYTDDRDNQGNTAAILAAKNDNWEFAILLLKHGARTDVRDQSQRSLLHICAMRGSSLDPITCETVVTLCVNNGAAVDDRDAQGCPALHLAVESHSWTVFEVLVKLGADFMCRDSNGYNVLHKMARVESKHVQDVTLLFTLLVERHADLNTRNPEGDAVIHIATKLQNWTLVNHLVNLKADINLSNSEGFTVLHLLALSKPLSQEGELWKTKAICNNEITVESLFDILLERGIDLNLRCSTIETAFHLAARHENWLMVKYLIQLGANILEVDIEGISVLQRLICSNSEIRDIEIFLSFLHDYIDPSCVPIAGGNTLLQLAAKHEKWEIVVYILKHWGGNVDHLDSEGCSILHRMATSRGRTFKEGEWCFSIRPIFNSSTNLNKHVRHDLIHQVAAAGNVDVVDALLDNFDDVNRADNEGFTVLHRVAQCCVSTSVAIIRRLVEKGADVDKRCPDGNTAVQLAAKSNNWLAVQHLLKYGAMATTLDADGTTVLHRLLSQPQLQCKKCVLSPDIKIPVLLVTCILFQGALINQRDLHDKTPLHLAVKNEHWDMVTELVARGSSMNERDSCGYTALHIIAKRRPKTRKTLTESSCVTCSINCCLNVQILNSDLPNEDSSHLVICDYFVDNSFLIDLLDPDGNTALMLSAKHNNWDVTERLLLKGADVCKLDPNGLSIVHVLASVTPKCGSNLLSPELSKKILELLISRGADVSAPDPEGNTPIQVAAKHGNMDMVERLLEFQDNVNETDSEGFTLLSRVAQTSSPKCEDIAKRLLEKGADVNMTCPNGKTPLALCDIRQLEYNIFIVF